MKKKKIVHPKLYFDVTYTGNKLFSSFISNKFDINGKRKIEQEILNNDIKINEKKYLFDLNVLQFDLLKKYIEIQKRVLVKHQKNRNYDSSRVVNYSISSMNEFKRIFEKWFNDNK